MRRQYMGWTAVILLSATIPTVARAANILEITLDKYEASGGGFLYDVFAAGAAKDDGVSCELTTPFGTYSLSEVSGAFLPGLDFVNDHTELSFAALRTAIDADWSLTWNEGATVATIDFGTILEDESVWEFVPAITSPVDGSPIEVPGGPNPPAIMWMYANTMSPCEAQLDYVTVNLLEQAGAEIESGELECDVLSWTPPDPLPEGFWLTRVANVDSALRLVPVGITVVGDPWLLENDDWLSLRSVDTSLIPISVEPMSWGRIKATYR